MKKTYQNPITIITHIETVKMLAASETLSIEGEVTTAEGAEGRRHFSVWGDDDDEEE